MKYNIIMLSIYIIALIFKIMKNEPGVEYQFGWIITIIMTPFAVYWIYQIFVDIIDKQKPDSEE